MEWPKRFDSKWVSYWQSGPQLEMSFSPTCNKNWMASQGRNTN